MTNCKKTIAIMLSVIMVFTMGIFTASLSTANAATKKASSPSSHTYKIYVNKLRNVATVYKKVNGKYKPVRAMLVSCGKYGSATPSGNFKIRTRERWHLLGGPSEGGYCWGQYVCEITGAYYFHSVWYRTHSKSSQPYTEFNKLGRAASHGCVRLSCMDAKWIYDHCGIGTPVKIYSSNKSGALGRPKKVYSSSGWDPTDPSKANPHFKLKPTIVISKVKAELAKTIEYASKYIVKAGVKAKNYYACEDLTGSLKASIFKRISGGSYVKAAFSTKTLGTYKVTYSVKNKYCGHTSKSLILKVIDSKKPVITAKSRTVIIGAKDAVKDVSAAQVSGASRTKAIKVTITDPKGAVTKDMSYTAAKDYVFSTGGKYEVVYKVKSKYNTKTATKKITITAKDSLEKPVITIPENISVTVDIKAGESVSDVKSRIASNVTVTDARDAAAKITADNITLDKDTFVAGETVNVTITYTDSSGQNVTKSVKLAVS